MIYVLSFFRARFKKQGFTFKSKRIINNSNVCLIAPSEQAVPANCKVLKV